MKKLIAVLLCVATVFSFAACTNNDGNKDNEKITGKDVAVKTENFSFNMSEATYLFNRYYQEFLEENAQYLSFYGIDKTKSLKEQQYTDDETWFDYFLDMTTSYITELLLFCEGAKANGVVLSEEDQELIDGIIDEYIEEADGNDYSIEEYVTLAYGTDVTIEDIKTFMEKEQLAFNYYNNLIDTYVFTEEEENEYLNENPDQFYYVNYASYTFDESKDRDAMMNARELSETDSADAFYAYIDKYETEVLKLEDTKKTGATVSEYELKDGALGDWAFSITTSVGDKYIVENGAKGIYTTYMLLSEPALQEYNVRDIRYICLTKKTYSTNEDAKNKANDILADFETNGKTAEAFGKLAEKYSEDTSTNKNGGICEDVSLGNSILDEEGRKWLFEEANVGDCKVFKGEEMYYIVYYEREGRTQWRVDAANALAMSRYVSDTDKLKADYNVEEISDVLNAINE